MLTYAFATRYMLLSPRLYLIADVCARMLTYADVC
jgi:hypothetical protein